MVKYGLLALSLIMSLLAQINLKVTSPRLPTSWNDLQLLGWYDAAILALRVGTISGLSLVLSWYAYKKFSFLEFLISTTLFYPMAGIIGYVFFREAYKWNHLVATLLIIIALIIYNMDLWLAR